MLSLLAVRPVDLQSEPKSSASSFEVIEAL
jgi:hypothetical protein